jgi:rhamnopyranosyl-N-acetylglucosaminyl-diphospho-decaprenol beta-1,3/1,4-galactofuranosyltransferase
MSEPLYIAKGVAAVFVTMNRCEIASTCLAKLAGQTRRPERVFVVDNASTDGTRKMLAEMSARHPEWIVVIESERNLGNAGGMQITMEKVFAEGFDAVWILDDDSWPEPEALAFLLEADLPADAVRSCRVVDLATGGLSWPVQLASGGEWQLHETLDALPEGEVLRIRRSWLGALIPREVYQTVGPVEGRLFLRGEDEDYPRRIERAGFSVFMITGSLLHHPAAGTLKRWEFAGRTMILESGLAGDKLYYRLRNTWWITRRDHGAFEASVTALLNGLALLRWEDSTSNWLPVWWEAARDAFAGRLGKRGG